MDNGKQTPTVLMFIINFEIRRKFIACETVSCTYTHFCRTLEFTQILFDVTFDFQIYTKWKSLHTHTQSLLFPKRIQFDCALLLRSH